MSTAGRRCILNEESACDCRHGDVVEVAEDMMTTKTKRGTNSPEGPTECKDGNLTARVLHNTLRVTCRRLEAADGPVQGVCHLHRQPAPSLLAMDHAATLQGVGCEVQGVRCEV